MHPFAQWPPLCDDPPGPLLSSNHHQRYSHSATPPWCEQVPLRERLKLKVPSLHRALAPAGGRPSGVRTGDGTHSPRELM
jgi:hypothetical protein